MDHVVAAQPNAKSQPDEQFRMRCAAGNPAGLLFVQALRELHPLLRVDASRMQRAQRPREFAHLQKELSREAAQSRLRDIALVNTMANRMTPERTPLFHHRENFAHEAVIRSHG